MQRIARLPGRTATVTAAVVTAAALAAGTGPASGTAVTRTASTAAARPASLTTAQESAYTTCEPILHGTPVSSFPIEGPFPASDYVAGYSNAAKMSESALVPSALLDTTSSSADGVYLENTPTGKCTVVALRPDYDGTPSLPPFTATFLGFGFMPVTATVQLTQVGLKDPPPIITVVDGQNVAPYIIVSTAQLTLRVLRASVNGTALNVGPDCRTDGPLSTPDPVVDPRNDLLVLAGGDAPDDPLPPFSSASYGGAVTGDATIPSFTGCGSAGDNLDPVLDASISGPGNYVKNDVGPVCAPQAALTICAPGSTTTALPPLWSVRDGGSFTATEPATFTPFGLGNPLLTKRATISCNASTIAVSLANASGPPRGAFGTFQWTDLSGCTSTPGGETWTWVVSEPTAATLSSQRYGLPTLPDGTAALTAAGVDLTFDGSGPGGQECHATADETVDNMAISYPDPQAGDTTARTMTAGFGGVQLTVTSSSNGSGGSCSTTVFPPVGTATNGSPYAMTPLGQYTTSAPIVITSP